MKLYRLVYGGIFISHGDVYPPEPARGPGRIPVLETHNLYTETDPVFRHVVEKVVERVSGG